MTNNRTLLLYLTFEEICRELQKEFDEIPEFHEMADLDVKEAKKEMVIDYLLKDGDSEFVSAIKGIFDTR